MRNFDRFTFGALCGYLLVFLGTVFIADPRNARMIMTAYSFFLMFLELFRGYYFRQPFDRIGIIGYGLIGIYMGANI